MNKIILTLFVLVLCTTFASAVLCEDGCQEVTTVGGTIYQGSLSEGVDGADVTVTCNNNTRDTTSDVEGAYSVTFNGSECGLNDTVTVNAQKDALTGENTGAIDMTYHYNLGCFCCFDLNVGIVNVPLIPEFGVIIGTLTLASAIVVFFVIRKK